MDDLRLAALARRQGGVVTTGQILSCGLSRSGIRHRVVRSRLFPIRRCAFTLGPVQDLAAHHWAAVLTSGRDQASLSHWSASLVHGMSKARPSAIHVTLCGGGGRTAAGLHVHRTRAMTDDDVVLVDGLRVTSPGRTVLDVAACADDPAVRRLIREGEFHGLLPAGAMLAVVQAHPGHPGAARVRRVDPATVEAALTQTPLEDELDALIRSLPLPPPDRQVPLRGVSGARYRMDFGWSPIRLAAEADGRSAHERASSLEADRFRDNDLASIGWLTLRFTRAQLENGRQDAARQLLATAARRGWGGPHV